MATKTDDPKRKVGAYLATEKELYQVVAIREGSYGRQIVDAVNVRHPLMYDGSCYTTPLDEDTIKEARLIVPAPDPEIERLEAALAAPALEIAPDDHQIESD
jgi:hypothetical protein